jgi:phenylacetate-CoA ligase
MRRLLWNLNLQRNGKAYSKYLELKKYEMLPELDRQKIQEERLKKILLHAYKNVPYYTRILSEASVVVGEDVFLDNFTRIPVLDKDIIRKNDLVSKDINGRKWIYNTSGGSTGTPIKIVQDMEYLSWNMAASELFMNNCGYKVPMRRVTLWGSERDIRSKRSIKSNIVLWMTNNEFLNAYNISPDKMKEYVSIINEKKPNLIHAYAESLYQFALFLERENISVYSPEVIITSAGTLFPYMRDIIEKTFNSKIYNLYGSREVGAIACEKIGESGMHVSTYTQYIELLDRNTTPVSYGQEGELIVTSLTNYGMPLIRYKIGDVAQWSDIYKTEQIRPSIIENVKGRVSDNFIKRDGSITFGSYFRHLLFFMDWIDKYQIVQEDYEKVIFYIKPISKVPNNFPVDFDSIIKDVKLVMGEDCSVAYKVVDRIDNSTSGKYRYTISKVFDSKLK